MSFPRYDSYKDSGVEWLGEVPGHWRVVPFYSVASEREESNKGMVEDNLLSLSYGRIIQKDISTNDGLLPESFETYQIVRQGDIVFRLTDLQNDKRSLRTAIVEDTKGIITSAYLASVPFGIVSSYLSYLLRAYDIMKVFYSMGGGLRQSMKFSDVKRLPILTPLKNEQQTIAAFLDRETAKIDALIAEQQGLIGLLKEKRQAVISHAVTQGINPDAPMKASGIEWLGEVPEHWLLGAIKHFVLQKPGAIKTGPFGSHLISADMQAGEIKVYNQRSVIDNDFLSGENSISEEKFKQLSSFETFPSDLLITTRGTIGRAAILPENAERGILHPCLLRIQLDKSKVSTQFLKSLIQDSNLVKNQISYMSNATTIEVIYSETIASVVIPVPPLSEQEVILEFLHSETAQLDTLSAEAQHAVELLKERRAALISAAVTGKIDVRNFKLTGG